MTTDIDPLDYRLLEMEVDRLRAELARLQRMVDAGENARAVQRRVTALRDAQLQRQADEEGCGAVLGAAMMQFWQSEEQT